MYHITIDSLHAASSSPESHYRRTMADVFWLCSQIVDGACDAYKAYGCLTVLDVNEGKDETVVTLGIEATDKMPLVSISVKEVPYEVSSGLMDLRNHVMLAC